MNFKFSPALKVALIYLIFSLIWIFTSDQVVAKISNSTEMLNFLQTIKGWIFVGFTSLLIYILINKHFKKEQKAREEIEEIVKFRTQELKESNDELDQTITHLKTTQEQLIKSEKMASLGNLVAGIAHELNTPVGNCFTATTYLREINDAIKKDYENEQMSEDEFKRFLNTSNSLAQSIYANSKSTIDLVNSFKQISVDQSHEQKRIFNIKSYIDGILLSLSNIIKKANVNIKLQCDNNLEINSYPGSFSQILTNLIVNSIKHGFKSKESGNILISIEYKNNKLTIVYEDDGEGISKINLSKIYDPFFTTNRENGGTGLGLNVVYNIVELQLKGKIICNSEEGKGTKFLIEYFII